jgi:excisionase family DNA binding protein
MIDLLTPAGAARILGVVPATVRQLAISGQLPAVRTESGMRLFHREDVERLAADRRQNVRARSSNCDAAVIREEECCE